MKKILIAICIAVIGMNLYSAGAKPQKLVIGDIPDRVEINPEGYIFYKLNGRTMFNLMLQVHWQHFAHQSKDLKIAKQGKNVLRSAGSFANIQFSSRTRLHNFRAETEYQVNGISGEPDRRQRVRFLKALGSHPGFRHETAERDGELHFFRNLRQRRQIQRKNPGDRQFPRPGPEFHGSQRARV